MLLINHDKTYSNKPQPGRNKFTSEPARQNHYHLLLPRQITVKICSTMISLLVVCLLVLSAHGGSLSVVQSSNSASASSSVQRPRSTNVQVVNTDMTQANVRTAVTIMREALVQCCTNHESMARYMRMQLKHRVPVGSAAATWSVACGTEFGYDAIAVQCSTANLMGCCPADGKRIMCAVWKSTCRSTGC